ncbi:MAG: PAS domain S-box protein [Methanomicrobiaceae archaeon]|nr:PAS domain S-box protein [Methanomicrobiaceae archaeon]
MIRLLLVDDEPVMLIMTKTFLEKNNADIECDTCSSAREALEKLAASSYDAIVSDYEMPEMDGIALLKAVRTCYSELPFILLTGRGREEVVIEALNEGADFYLQKSTEPTALYAELASKIRHAVGRQRAKEALERTQFSIDHLAAEFYWIDHEGCLIDVNEYVCQKLGFTRDELFAMRVPDVDSDHAIEDFEEVWHDLKEHQTLRMESHHRKRDGTVYPVELSLSSCQMGEKEFMCAFATDITERKRAEEALRESDERYRAVVENSLDSVYRLNLQAGYFDYMSPVIEEITGFTPDEINAMHIDGMLDRVHPDDRRSVSGELARAVASGRGIHEYRFRAKDGQYRWLADYFTVLRDRDGHPLYRVGVVRDITEHKEADEALRESESQYRTLVENMHDVVYSYSLDGHITYISPNVQTCFGYTPSEMIGHSLFEYLHPEDREAVLRDFQRTITTSEEFTTYCRLIQKDGSVSHVEEIARKVVDGAGTIVGYSGVIRDITQRKQAEEALQESKERYRAVVENSLDAVYRRDLQTDRYDYMSPVIEEITGFTPDEMNTMSIDEVLDRIHPDDRRPVDAELARAVASGRGILEYRFRGKDGHYRWLADHFTILRDRDGHPLYRGGVVRDVTERKQVEDELQSIARFPAENPNSTLRLDKGRSIIYANSAARTMLGDAFGGLGTDAPEDLAAIGETVLASGVRREGEFRIGEKTYLLTFVPFKDYGYVNVYCRDITERKLAEDALKDASKKLNLLTSITRHDILNQVTALKGFLALMQDPQHEGNEAEEMFHNLEKIADTIRRQITFTGDYQDMGERKPEWQQVEGAVTRAAESVRLNGASLAVDTGALEIFADPMLEKVFYNLLDNAVVHGERVEHITVSFHEEGDVGVLVFEDDGAGVPASRKDKIFERGVGTVTGFGLFLAKEILDITGISIRETGKEGKGARFEIEVPAGKWRMAEH